MLLVSEIFSEVERVLRACDDATVYNRISDAAEILCNKADIDPLLGWVDITTGGSRAFTLPREVDTVLAVNFSGRPSFPRNKWAEFHLNGLGNSDDTQQCEKFWDDKGGFPLFLDPDPDAPVRFAASTTAAGDAAEGELWVYGYDENDRWVVSTVEGATVDGYKVVLSSTPTAPVWAAPFFKRVTAVRKTASLGFWSLWGTSGGTYLTVAGSGSADTDGRYPPAGDLLNGRPHYYRNGIIDVSSRHLYWTGSAWVIDQLFTTLYTGTATENPWDATWSVSSGDAPAPGVSVTSGTAATALHGEYQPAETVPSFRRIRISQDAEWVRVAYRRKVFRVSAQTDLIPIHSRYALMLMVKALQKYDDDKIEEAAAYEAKAVSFLMEKQTASNPPGGPSFQVSNATRLISGRDRLL